jgi:hypothetical protein
MTLKNEGDVAFRVFGLTLHGEFNATRTWEKNKHEDAEDEEVVERIHPDTIPFKLNGSSLIPLFGNEQDHGDIQHGDIQHGDMNEDVKFSSLTLQPGQSVTLSFSSVIALQPDEDNAKHPAIVIRPIVGGNYTLRLMGEGFQTFIVKATS